MTIPSHARMYMDYLTGLGFVPQLVSDKQINFKVEGGHYHIMMDASDPTFFRLIYPRFRDVKDAVDLVLVSAAANHATASTKVAKVYLSSDNTSVSAAVELFCSPPESFAPVFERSLAVLQHAVKECNNHLAPGGKPVGGPR